MVLIRFDMAILSRCLTKLSRGELSRPSESRFYVSAVKTAPLLKTVPKCGLVFRERDTRTSSRTGILPEETHHEAQLQIGGAEKKAQK